MNTWQAQDNWNYVRGKHSFKSGVNWTYQRSPNTFLPNVNGQYSYGSLTNYVNGVLTSVTIAQGNPVLDFREYDTFLYGGDDWKISQNLTLNLGLTWTYYGNPAQLFTDVTNKREANPATAFWLQIAASIAKDQSSQPGSQEQLWPERGICLHSAVGRLPHRTWKDHLPRRLPFAV